MTVHVLMVTDMSGSMSQLASDVRGGYNSYLDTLAGDGHDYRVTACVFDTKYTPLCVDTPVGDAPRLDARNYSPRGYTALLDAVGRTIGEFERRVPELADDDKVLLVIQTDGRENSSREYRHDQIADLITARTGDGGRWSVLYVGAGLDTWEQAQSMGVPRSSYVGTHATGQGTRDWYEGLADGTTALAAGGSGDDVSHAVRHKAGK